jgi:hypothetical protein
MTTLVGQSFKTDGLNASFTVKKDKFWARGSHGPNDPNGPRLDALQPNDLMSVIYQGNPVPFIAVEGGVVKLERIEIGGEKIQGARKISEKLGVATKHLRKWVKKV